MPFLCLPWVHLAQAGVLTWPLEQRKEACFWVFGFICMFQFSANTISSVWENEVSFHSNNEKGIWESEYLLCFEIVAQLLIMVAAFHNCTFLPSEYPFFLDVLKCGDFFAFFTTFFQKSGFYIITIIKKERREKSISFSYHIHIVIILKLFASNLSRHLLLIQFLLMFGKNESWSLISFYYKYPSI